MIQHNTGSFMRVKILSLIKLSNNQIIITMMYLISNSYLTGFHDSKNSSWPETAHGHKNSSVHVVRGRWGLVRPHWPGGNLLSLHLI